MLESFALLSRDWDDRAGGSSVIIEVRRYSVRLTERIGETDKIPKSSHSTPSITAILQRRKVADTSRTVIWVCRHPLVSTSLDFPSPPIPMPSTSFRASAAASPTTPTTPATLTHHKPRPRPTPRRRRRILRPPARGIHKRDFLVASEDFFHGFDGRRGHVLLCD